MNAQLTLLDAGPARQKGDDGWQKAHDLILDAIGDGQDTPAGMTVTLNNRHKTTRYQRPSISKRMAELAAWGQLTVVGKQGQPTSTGEPNDYP